MEKGDTLYCKKYFFYNCHFFPGDKFEILDVNTDYVFLKTKLGLSILMNTNKKKQMVFNKHYYIWDFLQTTIEFRKYKLEKLNELQER